MASKTLKCDQCGANLPPAEPLETVKCAFCGAASIVQPPGQAPPVPPVALPRSPVFTVKRRGSGGGVGCTLLTLVVALLGLCLPLVLGVLAALRSTQITASLLGTFTAVPWQGLAGPILVDVNADGTPDVVGRIRRSNPGDSVCLAAYDGATGSPLWESARLGTYMETYQGNLVLAENLLVFADPAGGLSSFDVHTGAPGWTASLPEVGKRFCETGVEDAAFEVELADDRKVVVGRDGRVRGTSKDWGCTSLPTESGDLRAPELRRTVEGFRGSGAIVAEDGTQFWVGQRDKGTPVPLLVGLHDDPALNWEVDIAAVKPLQTSLPFPPVGAVNADAVFVAYEREGSNDAFYVVAFDRGGRRRWEAELPERGPLTALVATDRFLYVAEWGHLSALDVTTGKTVWD